MPGGDSMGALEAARNDGPRPPANVRTAKNHLIFSLQYEYLLHTFISYINLVEYCILIIPSSTSKYKYI